MRPALAILAFALLAAAPAQAAPADEFHRLLDDHYQWLLRENPVQATALGVRTYDSLLADPSLAADDRPAAEAAAFLARLEHIPAASLSAEDRTNRAILKRSLEGIVEGNRYPQRTMLFTTYSGWHQDFADLANNVPLRTKADFQSYLARLGAYPKFNDAALAVTEQAVRGGYVLPCSVLGNFERSISGVIADDPTKSRFYEPFAGPRPAAVGEADWAGMQRRARRLVVEVLNPA